MNNPNPKQATEGIWIPRDVWIARDLSLREKALLATIRAQDPDEDYLATNQQLTEILDISERHLQSCLTTLRERGLITIRVNDERQRILRATGKSVQPSKRAAQRIGRRSSRPRINAKRVKRTKPSA